MNNIIKGDKYRITVMTPSLIRLEYSEDGIFEDRKTQTVVNRDFPEPEFKLIESSDEMEILTSNLHLIYNRQKFSLNGLSIEVLNGQGMVWHYGYRGRNLKGTTKTLDDIDGACELQDGILSLSGYAILDDSKSIIQTEDGWVEPRKKDQIDLYFFGYGRNYLGALNDYYKLSGKTPMLPRYALGNWWSRYYPYTQQEYKDLMTNFENHGIPISVSVIDMDWHLVDIDPKYGDGWTGYTWNKELFPDPVEFMAWLHEKGKKIALNVHPAQGVRPHEEMYKEMAEALGVDWQNEIPINFDITNRDFLNAYFKYLHHPHEKNGVDFWWIDWQQGAGSKIEGLDGLWMLNNYHYKDSCKDNKRGLIFSRYSGPGSHRYSVGFSGDTIISWESLDFQPYFTATASNIGYGWWSNDIGGHMFGTRNEDLTLRWYQFGVFSPIMRLHSMNNIFVSKEPWKFSMETEVNMTNILRLRHRMVPYLYTMNYHAWKDNLPLLKPMYYLNSEEENAYNVKNQYYFGDELIVMPITSPMNRTYGLSKVKGWLPEGTYVDIFTKRVYQGGRMMNFFRNSASIPVFAKAGSIFPLLDENDIMHIDKNPQRFDINIYGGADGEFELYEDDNVSLDYEKNKCVKTKMVFDFENGTFTINPAEGDTALIPEKRSFKLHFICAYGKNLKAEIDGREIPFEISEDKLNNTLTVFVSDVPVSSKLVISFGEKLSLCEKHINEDTFNMLEKAEIEYDLKLRIYNMILENPAAENILPQLYTMDIDSELIQIISEIITA